MTIDRTYAHKELVGRHNTIRFLSSYGCVSARKDAGRYIVRTERYDTGQTSRKEFATLPGALVALETLREYWI